MTIENKSNAYSGAVWVHAIISSLGVMGFLVLFGATILRMASGFGDPSLIIMLVLSLGLAGLFALTGVSALKGSGAKPHEWASAIGALAALGLGIGAAINQHAVMGLTAAIFAAYGISGFVIAVRRGKPQAAT